MAALRALMPSSWPTISFILQGLAFSERGVFKVRFRIYSSSRISLLSVRAARLRSVGLGMTCTFLFLYIT